MTGVRAPLGEFTSNQCSNRLKDDRLLHTNPYFACGNTALLQCQVQFWAKA